MDAAAGGGTRPGELWRHTAPYRGLAAMAENDSDYFFGRGGETVDVIGALAATPDKLPVLLGNSGVGKSSLAQAGVLAALERQAWPERWRLPGAWPQAFSESRRWCFLTLKPGTEPLKALVEPFLGTWQLDATDPERVRTADKLDRAAYATARSRCAICSTRPSAATRNCISPSRRPFSSISTRARSCTCAPRSASAAGFRR